PQVSALLWEIRRERRMEFAFEHSRIGDLERWHKLEYMDTDANPDLLSGAWVNFPVQLPELINNDLSVVSLDGQVTPYNGNNRNEMRGFYRHKSNRGRLPFLNQSNRSEEHTSELQSRENLVCRLLLEKKKNKNR